MASGRNGHTLVDFHLQIYNKNIDNSNKTVVFFYDKTHFLTRLVSLQPLKGLFNIPKPIFTTSPIHPGERGRRDFFTITLRSWRKGSLHIK